MTTKRNRPGESVCRGAIVSLLVLAVLLTTPLLAGASGAAAPRERGSVAAWNWTEVTVSGPATRHGAALAADPGGGHPFLFGGKAGSYLNDTWELDPGTPSWTQVAVLGTPPARRYHSMAWGAGGALLFGGVNGTGFANLMNDTWFLSGSPPKWAKLSPASSPGARFLAAMAWDASAGKFVLYGGSRFGPLNDTWLYDPSASSWTEALPGPAARYASSAAYVGGGRTLVFGGTIPATGKPLGETWVFDSSSGKWSNATVPSSPPARATAALAFDAARGVAVLFGGSDGSSRLNDTWLWDAATGKWLVASPVASPPVRQQHAMVWSGNRTFLFGGNDLSGNLGDVWTYAEVPPPPPPAPKIVLSIPADGTSGVDRNTSVRVEFSQTMDPATTVAAFTVSPSTTGATNVSGGNLTWVHPSPLAANTTYTVSVAGSARSVAGAAIGKAWSASFRTAALPPPPPPKTPPKVVTASPADGSRNVSNTTSITLVFNEPMDSASAVAAFSIVPTAAGSAHMAGSTLAWVPAEPLKGNTTYTFTVAKTAKSSDGIAMNASFTSAFTTAKDRVIPPPPPPPTNATIGLSVDSVLALIAVAGVGAAILFFLKRRRKPTVKEVLPEPEPVVAPAPIAAPIIEPEDDEVERLKTGEGDIMMTTKSMTIEREGRGEKLREGDLYRSREFRVGKGGTVSQKGSLTPEDRERRRKALDELRKRTRR